MTKQEFIEFLIKQENRHHDCWVCVSEDKNNWKQHYPTIDTMCDYINLNEEGKIKIRSHGENFETDYNDFVSNYKKTLKLSY